MKQIKRIGAIFIFLLVLLPIGNVFADTIDYKNGLLDNDSAILENTLPIYLYDNDIITGITPAGNYNHYVLTVDSVDISYMYLKHSTSAQYLEVIMDGEQVYKSNVAFEGYIKINKSAVNEIVVKRGSTGGPTVYEIDFFTGNQSPDSDGDGIPDEEDEYPDDPTNTPPPDSDGDGIPDNEDEYPDDPTNTPPPTKAEEVPEVKNLKVNATDKRADLSWDNPPRYFDKAVIYRKTLGTNQTASIFGLFAPVKVSAAEDYKPLFETNGTEFSDLTIEPESEYEYLVTTMYNGMESNGVTVQVTAPKPPLIDLENTKLPFGVKELINSGSGLLSFVGGFILLALAFVFVPKVIRLLRSAFRTPDHAGQTASERIRLDEGERRQAREQRETRQTSFTPREPRQSRRG